MAANTKINSLISTALRRQQRRNSEVEDIIKASIQNYIREDICTIFPFWFLRMEVGVGFIPEHLPMTQDDLDNFAHIAIPGHPDVDYWLHRGILRVKPGQHSYELFAPAEVPAGDSNGAYWVGAKFQKPLAIAPITLKGEVEPEIPCHNNQMFMHNIGCVRPGKPSVAYLESGRERDILRISPTPDRAYLLAVSWVLAEPLNYYLSPADAGTENYTNKFMQEHEEIYSFVVMLKISEYFGDLPNFEFYKRELFGEMNRGVGRLGGKLGDLKRAHERKLKQHKASIAIYKSNPLQQQPLIPDPWGRRMRYY